MNGSLRVNGRTLARYPWLVMLVVSAILTAVSFAWVDLPLAYHFHTGADRYRGLEQGLGSTILLTGEAAVFAAITLARLALGHLPRFWKVLWYACLTSVSAYLFNSLALKTVFGVPNPGNVLHGAAHAFSWFAGTENSAFPSGHMMLAAAFAGVFMRNYRATVVPLTIALLVSACLLVLGNWHFVSDLIAGTYIGLWAGWTIGRLCGPMSLRT